ncbi:MAG: TIGR00282 family metallophosphoesterase [Erysipelotrichaceae bacterium]|nr:TIGR00282 family metallophosphoesterase [Erysipelotrichaceae bacterium]
MKILLIGDIVGAIGREMIMKYVPILKKEHSLDLVIANGENSAHGKGLTKKIYDQLIQAGVDVITMGNHTFSKNDIYNFIDEAQNLVRPVNMEPTGYGKSTCIIQVKGKKVAVSNVCGEVFMYNVIDSPFLCMEEILENTEADIHIVDFHGEATSEKIAFTYRFAGEVQVVVGTHTHVQTADERIVKGTAAISDLGMCGAYESVLGRDVDEIVTRFTTNEKTKYTLATGPGIFCGAIVTIDEQNNQATHIERIQIRPKEV